ncbi:MAG: dipeptidase [Lacisediminihabitans sp.]
MKQVLGTIGVLLLVVVGVLILLPSIVERKLNTLRVPPPYDASGEAKALHKSLFVADMHADSLMFNRDLLHRSALGHVDIPRLVEGNVGLQLFTVVTQATASMKLDQNKASDSITMLAMVERWPIKTWRSFKERALHQAGKFESLAKRSRGTFFAIHNQGELERFLKERKANPSLTAGILGLEGAQALEGRLENLDVLYDAGFRMIGPTHFFDNELGGSAHGESKAGLTDFGRQVIRRMEEKHITVDLAHASTQMIEDVLNMATRPVVVSHTGVKGTMDNNRNLSDVQIRRIAATSGVIGIGFWETATGGTDARAIAKAIRYTVNLVGVEHVGLGSDFDGSVKEPFDATGLVQITEVLMAEGFSHDEIGKVMGGNVLRVFGENLPVG